MSTSSPEPSSGAGVPPNQIPSDSPPPLPEISPSPAPNYPPPPPYPPYRGYYPPPPPSPYPQAGYPYPSPRVPPPFYMLPQGYAPVYAPRQSSSLKPLWITLGVAASLILVLCAGCSLLFSLSLANLSSLPTGPTQTSTAQDPVLAAEAFCSYEIDKDYSSAYQQLSGNLQSQVSEQKFESDNEARDATVGSVVGCSAAQEPSATANQGATSSTITLTLNIWLASPTNSLAPPLGASGTMTMVEESTGWSIDAIGSTLQLT